MAENSKTLHAPDLDQLSAYLDRELDPGEQRRVAAHLATCPLCTAQLGELQELAVGLRALPTESLGVDLAGVIEGRIAAAPRLAMPGRRRGWLGRWPVALGAAASIAVGVFMGSALVAGGAVSTPRVTALHVFDALPPGSLCIGLDSCYVKGSVK